LILPGIEHTFSEKLNTDTSSRMTFIELEFVATGIRAGGRGVVKKQQRL